jgi:hypothetical protein
MERKLLFKLTRPELFLKQLVFYRDHTISNVSRLYGSGRDPAQVTPIALITWSRPDALRCVMCRVICEKLYPTEEDASVAAIEQARMWVDRHVSVL